MGSTFRQVVPRFRRHHVGWADLLFHLAGRSIRQNLKPHRKPLPTEGARAVDGPQRWFLHRRTAEITRGISGSGSLVQVGSSHDLAERNGAAVSPLLFRRRIDRYRRSGHFPGQGDRDRFGCRGVGLDYLRPGGEVVPGEITRRICDIFTRHDRGGRVGTGHMFSVDGRRTSTSGRSSEPS